MAQDLNPDFPVVGGDYLLTRGWRIELPEQFNRRIEDGSLVLWKPGLTFWINVWNNDRKAAVDELLASIVANANPARTREKIERGDALARLTYELSEEDADEPGSMQESINGYVFAAAGYVQISAYWESPQAQALARSIIESVRTDS